MTTAPAPTTARPGDPPRDKPRRDGHELAWLIDHRAQSPRRSPSPRSSSAASCTRSVPELRRSLLNVSLERGSLEPTSEQTMTARPNKLDQLLCIGRLALWD
jgi:hypothetical protein